MIREWIRLLHTLFSECNPILKYIYIFLLIHFFSTIYFYCLVKYSLMLKKKLQLFPFIVIGDSYIYTNVNKNISQLKCVEFHFNRQDFPFSWFSFVFLLLVKWDIYFIFNLFFRCSLYVLKLPVPKYYLSIFQNWWSEIFLHFRFKVFQILRWNRMSIIMSCLSYLLNGLIFIIYEGNKFYN